MSLETKTATNDTKIQFRETRCSFHMNEIGRFRVHITTNNAWAFEKLILQIIMHSIERNPLKQRLLTFWISGTYGNILCVSGLFLSQFLPLTKWSSKIVRST
jgi:hypothetical protein